MKARLKLLLVFPEIAPFAKTGDLGEVGGTFPKALKEMGHDVRVIMPQYRVINERKYVLRDVIRLQNIDISLGEESIRINVKSAFLPGSKVQVYFIDYKPFFFRQGLYSDPKTGREYADNDKRFTLFAKGVLKTLVKLQWQPDVIHCHDWQSALVPFFLKTLNKNDSFFAKTFSLFTVYNFSSQGDFDSDCVSCLGLDSDFVFQGSSIDFNGRCNFLKAGITSADIVNTVSEKYAEEVQSAPDYGFGMEEVLRQRDDSFYGVVNGIDYKEWSPETDGLIPEKYDVNNISGKRKSKHALLEKYGLPFSDNIPAVVMILPSVDQEGADLIKRAVDEMMHLNIYFIVLGKGKGSDYTFFEKVRKRYKNRVGIGLDFDNSLAHLVTAGADIILMPSKVEPCGLTQLCALRYGTVPLVRLTGGLADTVQPFDPDTEKGTGFVFNDFDVKEFLITLEQAVQIFQDQKTWTTIMKNGMQEDFSWDASARKYVQLYGKCLSKNK